MHLHFFLSHMSGGLRNAVQMQLQVLCAVVSLKLCYERMQCAARWAAIQTLQTISADKQAALDFILMAFHGKKIGCAKVIETIDDLVKGLEADQVDDDAKKEHCNTEFDQADDKKKLLEKGVAHLETATVKCDDEITSTTG